MTLRNVIVMAVLAALAVLLWVAVGDDPGGEGKLPANLPEFRKDEVSKVVATRDGRSIVLRRRTDRSDAWDVEEGATTLRADAAQVDELLSLLARQAVVQRVLEKGKVASSPDDVKGYGLDAPSIVIELTVPGQPVTVRYGKRSRSGESVYMDLGPGTDVWLVAGAVEDHLVSAGATNFRARRLTDLRLFDVGRVEVLKDGAVSLEAERDPTQIWRVKQPYEGFADPTAFENYLSRLVNVDVADWVELDAPSLARHGLETPRWEVRLTPKRGGDPWVLLVGNDVKDPKLGDVVVVAEKGRKNVAATHPRLVEALRTPAIELRDRSFTRLGTDGVALLVKLGGTAYQLRKEGASWDIEKPDRTKASDSKVQEVLELIRSWKTYDYPSIAPDAAGIREDGDVVEIELQGGGKTTLRIGNPGPDGRRYAQRNSAEGVGGVELVDEAPVAALAKGYAQFRRQEVREFGTYMTDLEVIAREGGYGDAGQKVQTVVIQRDVGAKSGWKFHPTRGDGAVGTIDADGVNRVFTALAGLNTKEWIPYSETKETNDRMGFKPPLGETFALSLEFATTHGTPPGGEKQTLMVGKPHPSGGYYARFGDAATTGWAFVLSEEDAQALMAPLAK